MLVDSLQAIADDRTTRPRTASAANGFADLMLQFRFFFGVRLVQHALKATTPAMRSAQGQSQSVSENLGIMDGLKTAVAGQRDRFDEFWASTVSHAKELGVDEPRNTRQSRPPRRLDDDAPPAHPTTPEDAYRCVYYDTLDRLLATDTNALILSPCID